MATAICLVEPDAVVHSQIAHHPLLAGVLGYRTLCYMAEWISKGPDFPLKVPKNDNGSVQFKNPNSFKCCFGEFQTALDESLRQVFHTMDHVVKALPGTKEMLDNVEKLFEERDKSKIIDLLESYLSPWEQFLAKANSDVADTMGKLERAIGLLDVIKESFTEAKDKERNKLDKEERLRDLKKAAMNEQPKPAAEEDPQGETFGAKLKRWLLCCHGKEASYEPPNSEQRKDPTAEELLEMDVLRTERENEMLTKEGIVNTIEASLENLEHMRAQWTVLETTLMGFSTTFNTKLDQRLTMYMNIAKKCDPKFQQELKNSAWEVESGCNSICTLANCYWEIHSFSLHPMMLMFPIFISNKATAADRSHLNELVEKAEWIIQDTASGKMGPRREELTVPSPLTKMIAFKGLLKSLPKRFFASNQS